MVARFLAAGACLALAACVTKPRVYSVSELGRVAQSCGYALGELVQEADEPRILFVFSVAEANQVDQACVYRWARPRRLHVAFLAVELAQ